MTANVQSITGIQDIKPVTLGDIADIYRIEIKAYSYPWSEGLLKSCLGPGYFFYALVDVDARIVGYAILNCILDEAHLLNICIKPSFQGQGLGGQLLDRMIDIASRQRIDTLFLEVRASNQAARRLYEKHGFNQYGLRAHYYPADEGREDAVLYARRLC